MVAEVPPIVVEGRVGVCDGTGPYSEPHALGHPKVYINLVCCPTLTLVTMNLDQAWI